MDVALPWLLQRMLPALGIAVRQTPRVEADDVIATLALNALEQSADMQARTVRCMSAPRARGARPAPPARPRQVVIQSSDGDFKQLLQPRLRLCRSRMREGGGQPVVELVDATEEDSW